MKRLRHIHLISVMVVSILLCLHFTGCGEKGVEEDESSKYSSDTIGKEETREYESRYLLPELTTEVAALIRACDNFEKTYPEDERVSSVLLKEGEAYYFFKHYDQAMNAFNEIYLNYPQGTEYMYACEHIAKIYFDMGDYVEAERWYATTREVSEGMGETETLERVSQLEAASSFKYAETYGEELAEVETPEEIPPDVKEKAIEQAQLFEETADKNPGTDIGKRSLGKAAETYEKIYDWENVARVYLKYSKEYPDEENVPNAIASAAIAYEKLEEWNRAAETYKLLYDESKWKDEKFSIEAVYSAAVCYEKAGDWNRAEDLYKRYRESPKAMDASHLINAAFKMAKAQEEQGKYNDAKKSYEECIALYNYAKENDYDVDELAYYPAECQYILTEDIFEEYDEIELRMPEDVMARSLEKKVELYQTLEQMYNKVISYKVDIWLTAPIYKLAEINEDFADTLRNSEYPSDLTPEEFAMFAAALENEAFPMEQKAVEYYNNVITVADSYGISDEWTIKAQERLIALNPGIYAMVDDFSGVDVISDTSWKCSTSSPAPDWNMSTFDNSMWISAGTGQIKDKNLDDITNFKGTPNSQFIWATFDTEKPPQIVYFTKKISFHSEPKGREVRISVKEHYKFYVNGVLIGEDTDDKNEWKTAEVYDISAYLAVGDNILAIEAFCKSDDEYWFKFECYENE